MSDKTSETTVRILGIDPGSTCTGFGVVAGDGESFQYVASGSIRPSRTNDRHGRLREIFVRIEEVIQKHQPTHFAIEDVFFKKNAKSALALGEARGVAILAATLADLPVFEYSAREVKQSVTGHGGADKSQVDFMLGKILQLTTSLENTDESDALAVALCHAFKNRKWSVV